ncbi:MAG: tetratricopeptide repeat protein [Betaproteobacteria bacterium]
MLVSVPQRLLDILDLPEADSSLAEAALLVAQAGRPSVDVPGQLDALAELADQVSTRVSAEAPTLDRLAALNHFLFDELGFGPDADNYYDPRNSFLDEVIARRRGIPITLSIVYIHVGRQIGLDLSGIAFPGHFLVRCQVEDGVVVIDPYHHGESLSVEEIRQRLEAATGQAVPEDAVTDALDRASAREIVVRMLRNLKAIHFQKRDWMAALPVTDWLAQVAPDTPEELRDRGLVYEELECFRPALADFESYLRVLPESADAGKIRDRTVDLRKAVARLN